MAFEITSGRMVYDVDRSRPVSLQLAGSLETVNAQEDVIRKPNTVNQEERVKIGEILLKSRRLEALIEFE